MKGLLITFEGIDYSGKTLQVERFCRRLQANGAAVLSLRDPGATEISEKIRAILLDNSHSAMSAWTELLLYEAARAQMIEQLIKPALARGQVVVCDRLYDSTTAYQGYGRQLDLGLVAMANRLGACGLIPDLTFLLDLPAGQATLRRQQRPGETDRMEGEGEIFQERVRQGYLRVAEGEPDRIRIVDANKEMESIEDVIWNVFIHQWPHYVRGQS
jgi:dTMP kinase